MCVCVCKCNINISINMNINISCCQAKHEHVSLVILTLTENMFLFWNCILLYIDMDNHLKYMHQTKSHQLVSILLKSPLCAASDGCIAWKSLIFTKLILSMTKASILFSVNFMFCHPFMLKLDEIF